MQLDLANVTAIYGGRGSGKTTLAKKMVAEAKPPRCLYFDPMAQDGASTAWEVVEQMRAGAAQIVCNSANKTEILGIIYSAYMSSSQARPLYLICDEAPLYLGQSTKALDKIMYQGRHRGLGMMILSQRPTAVDAGIRSQAAFTYWGRMTDHNDLGIAKQQIGPDRAKTLSTAQAGQFIRHPE